MENQVKDQGTKLESKLNKSQKECEDICDANKECKSFDYVPGQEKCHLYGNELVGNEPQRQMYDIYTVYKSCGEYVHKK